MLPIEVVFAGDRASMLRDGRADIALLYTPADDVRGLDTETLLSEAPVAVLPVSHPLVRRPSLRMAELERERLHKPDPTDGGTGGGISELMHLIAPGRTVAVLPQSLTTPLRDDLTTIPVTDVPPSVRVLAWPAHSTSSSGAALARSGAKAATAPQP
ncbi:LysR substrate-binding domain-containing protein [Actinomadura madurae]|nr:LysR substrate-binding domain-containing protein [Actinomadura madurae]